MIKTSKPLEFLYREFCLAYIGISLSSFSFTYITIQNMLEYKKTKTIIQIETPHKTNGRIKNRAFNYNLSHHKIICNVISVSKYMQERNFDRVSLVAQKRGWIERSQTRLKYSVCEVSYVH